MFKTMPEWSRLELLLSLTATFYSSIFCIICLLDVLSYANVEPLISVVKKQLSSVLHVIFSNISLTLPPDHYWP
jgi:hypothetical protein